jgi:hypothetical protein
MSVKDDFLKNMKAIAKSYGLRQAEEDPMTFERG